MRAWAVNHVLAQCGFYVFAKRFHANIVDKIALRFGSNDDILRGESSFEFELKHTDQIVRTATHRSLLFFDELAQSTDATSGQQLCSAVVKHLSDVGCRCVFATHFDLCVDVDGVEHRTMAVNKDASTLLDFYTYKMIRGKSNSAAIFVAEKVGLPEVIIERAKFLLCNAK